MWSIKVDHQIVVKCFFLESNAYSVLSLWAPQQADKGKTRSHGVRSTVPRCPLPASSRAGHERSECPSSTSNSHCIENSTHLPLTDSSSGTSNRALEGRALIDVLLRVLIAFISFSASVQCGHFSTPGRIQGWIWGSKIMIQSCTHVTLDYHMAWCLG